MSPDITRLAADISISSILMDLDLNAISVLVERSHNFSHEFSDITTDSPSLQSDACAEIVSRESQHSVELPLSADAQGLSETAGVAEDFGRERQDDSCSTIRTSGNGYDSSLLDLGFDLSLALRGALSERGSTQEPGTPGNGMVLNVLHEVDEI
jgi:hypothetical protein